MIKVAVCGALGKMGQEVCQAVSDCEDTELIAKIDIASRLNILPILFVAVKSSFKEISFLYCAFSSL